MGWLVSRAGRRGWGLLRRPAAGRSARGRVACLAGRLRGAWARCGRACLAGARCGALGGGVACLAGRRGRLDAGGAHASPTRCEAPVGGGMSRQPAAGAWWAGRAVPRAPESAKAPAPHRHRGPPQGEWLTPPAASPAGR
ncbi:hypothetical protein SHJG_4107 [Streptomyces hygroscopicus subsp. jinggangensis 5008]|nr:hypothetical protein SHJG_4107 [Streptomyces hygroscopicus subsp. jinggangensis 5008]AGF63537.1 hypothetical protein SHJGH_3872 [Streptomyces hygroscopicus subsp. jinggangensis TL01]